MFQKGKIIFGERYAYLTPISEAGKIGGAISYHCICVCGKQVEVKGIALRDGNKKSCGCMRGVEKRSSKYNHPTEYATWQGMKRRCFDEKDKRYARYGGRGITVCKEWVDSFDQFYLDVGAKPDGYSIERIDNNGNYCKENCKWIPMLEQAKNKGTYKNNQCLVTGIWKRRYGFSSSIQRDGKKSSLYSGPDFFEAVCARKSAELSSIVERK